jgi:hypothetical protein
MPEETCIALYVQYGPGVSLKATNFERTRTGETIHLNCWKLYEVHFIDFREYHHHLIATYPTSSEALHFAHEIAAELRF